MTKEERKVLWEWEDIARKALVTPNISRSEVDTVIIGIKQSDDEQLKGAMDKLREKAWKHKQIK
tara:strand:- start:2545 stop:2736 length:192 start_codon:yes stop_codon:yes gene_type:complete